MAETKVAFPSPSQSQTQTRGKRCFKMNVISCPVCSTSHLPATGGDLKQGVYATTCENCGHFFKFTAKQATSSSVTFSVNGKSYSVSNEYDPATSLNEFLRQTGISRGTKQMCIEGGCGVCLVTVKLYDPLSKADVFYSVNSCLVQLYMCDGWEITTIEGLGSTTASLHPIQERLAQHNGSQCGFCSPAQVMNMYGLLKKKPAPTMQEVEDNFDDTICRCTGYRSILDAMKSFCVDASPNLQGGPIDIEELDGKICGKSGLPCTGQCHPSTLSTGALQGDHGGPSTPLHIVTATAQWFKPANTADLYTLLDKYRSQKYRLLFGNTGFGVYKDIGPWLYDILIDIRGINVFYNIQMADVITVGANVSLNNLLDLFENNAQLQDLSYFGPFAAHLKQVASNTVRNIASWAGSLMLKHQHRDFVSDIFTLMETVNTTLLIGDGSGEENLYSLTQFLDDEMKGKVIIAAILPRYPDGRNHIKTYRVAQRLQKAHGYVTCGFNIILDDNLVVGPFPSMVYQGINSTLNRATKTEEYLTGRQLKDSMVLRTALEILGEELKADSHPVLASPEYRTRLAQALFYKFVLETCGPSVVDPRFYSGSSMLVRPVSSGSQSYDTHKDKWPLTEPTTKRDAIYQTTGEVRFLDDERLLQDEAHAAFVISDVANADIKDIDASAALSLPGVYKFLTAKDFPEGGDNNFMPPSVYSDKEEIFSSGKILYAGQPLGLIVASDTMTAETAASMVKVTYTDVKPPLLDLKQAIQQKSFFPDAVPDPLIVGDPDGAIAKSPRRVKGSIECGSQAHFQLEPQTARCMPDDNGGMIVQATTQWMDATSEVVSKALNMAESSVSVEVKRLGGAFGSKISRNFQVSGACALAAYHMQRPVRLKMGFHTNMKSLGKRFPFLADYEVGFTEDGKLNGVKILFYGDCGSCPNDNSIPLMFSWMDNAYFCENWNFTPFAVKTNKPSNTYCRAPGSLPAQFFMESIMEHVARDLKMDPTHVRVLNLYKKGQKSPRGMPLNYCNIGSIVTQLQQSSGFEERQKQIATFNKANRWKKKGVSLVPTRFGLMWQSVHYNVLVAVYHSDGTIAIQHAGIEVGQGINQKMRQVCAYELGVSVDLICVTKHSNVPNANSATTGGSTTSELNALGVIKCCELLKSRMLPVKNTMPAGSTWQQLVTKCFNQGVDLSARYYTNPADTYDSHYNVYAAVVTEAELDVLTGQSQLSRVDILYDCGQSMNPELDVGQVEGGFMMALGYHLTEKMKYDPQTGVALTAGTWEYKPPMPKDLPIDFRISLLKNAPNPLGVLSSKAAGEPPIVLAASALFAIKHAVESARAEIDKDTFFTMNSPALVEDVHTACLVDPAQFVLKPAM